LWFGLASSKLLENIFRSSTPHQSPLAGCLREKKSLLHVPLNSNNDAPHHALQGTGRAKIGLILLHNNPISEKESSYWGMLLIMHCKGQVGLRNMSPLELIIIWLMYLFFFYYKTIRSARRQAHTGICGTTTRGFNKSLCQCSNFVVEFSIMK
jgi:hypothetical protein